MHSVFILLAILWDGSVHCEAYVGDRAGEAREDYEKARADQSVKHARLYQNPVANGGVFDSDFRPDSAPEVDPAEVERKAAEEAAAEEKEDSPAGEDSPAPSSGRSRRR